MTTIAEHYSRQSAFQAVHQALDRIAAQIAEGHLKPLSLQQTAALDQFHVGGLKANIALAERLPLNGESHILDAGCGLGGPARHLASHFGARVTGVDLTDEFCLLARKLNALTATSRVEILCADVLDTGLAGSSFDAVWTQHVAMNIVNRQQLYREFARLLKSGGLLAIHDVVKGTGEPISYPLPWSSDGKHSHVISRTELFSLLTEAGFSLLHAEDVTGQSIAALDKAIALPSSMATDMSNTALPNLGDLLGPTFLTARINLRRQLDSGSLGLLQTVWQKGSSG